MMKNDSSSISKFYDANEGFKKGNLDKTSYRPYKNYQEKEPTFINPKEALLLFIQKCDLAITDLTLYLDIVDNDESVIKMYNFYKEEYDKAKEKYLKEYGPLTSCQITPRFTWNDKPFPWENK
ncbi:MAG: spore coat protein CotJB [Erysipelotrichaceae bacterium]|nr:spore coat protein CotJB [Erysipelotrichaceae bacterium]